jgi:serine O-acetyltransferase
MSKMTFREKVRSILYRKQGKAYYWKLRHNAMHCPFYPLRWIYLQKHRRLMEKHNADIPYETTFAGPPIFPHGLSGIYMSTGAKIGKDCVIFQQVTIGSNALPDSKHQGCPTIGDHVYIGAGAKIIGNVRVGNHVRIGANCVVTEDIPDNATVVLGKPRILLRDAPQDNSCISPKQIQK